MGIEEQIDRLIDLGEDIKSRLDLLVQLASNHFADANKMVADEPAKEPEHPASEKPLEPEYREPVLPGDVMQECEFSMTGKDWYKGLLAGFHIDNTHPWISSNLGSWKYARIKKDA